MRWLIWRCPWWLIAPAGGLVVGAALWLVVAADLAHRWERLPPPPAPLSAIITIDESNLYVRGTDGRVYTIDAAYGDSWAPAERAPDPEGFGPDKTSVAACDRSDGRFRWTAAAPADERECLEGTTMYIGYLTLSVIRDSQDQLWYFSTVGTDFMPGFGALVVGLGGFIGGAGIAYAPFAIVRSVGPTRPAGAGGS